MIKAQSSNLCLEKKKSACFRNRKVRTRTGALPALTVSPTTKAGGGGSQVPGGNIPRGDTQMGIEVRSPSNPQAASTMTVNTLGSRPNLPLHVCGPVCTCTPSLASPSRLLSPLRTPWFTGPARQPPRKLEETRSALRDSVSLNRKKPLLLLSQEHLESLLSL